MFPEPVCYDGQESGHLASYRLRYPPRGVPLNCFRFRHDCLRGCLGLFIEALEDYIQGALEHGADSDRANVRRIIVDTRAVCYLDFIQPNLNEQRSKGSCVKALGYARRTPADTPGIHLKCN